MSTRSRYLSDVLEFYDSLSQERVLPVAPVSFYDEFLATTLSSAWTARDTNLATETAKANAPNGSWELALTSANEIQLAGLDFGDQRPFVLNQGLVFEARVKFTVLPTGGVVALVGLCGAHNAAADTVAQSMWFRLDGAAALTVEADDTVNETTKVATAVTIVINQWYILRIECTDPTQLAFYVDGVMVAAGTVFNFNTVPTLALQPVLRIGKESAAATVGTMEVDYVRCWQRRAA